MDARNDNVVEGLTELTGGAGVDVAIDFVSSRQTLESAVQSLGKGGRMVTLGGGNDDKMFEVSAGELLTKELQVMGSRYVTKQEVVESLDLVARGQFWPLVTEIAPLKEAEALHARVEQGLVTGRAALRVSE